MSPSVSEEGRVGEGDVKVFKSNMEMLEKRYRRNIKDLVSL